MAQTIADTSSAFSRSGVAATLEFHRKTIRDNVSDRTPLLSFLMGELGRTRRSNANFENTDGLPGVFMGGRDIRVPVQLELNETVGSYEGADTLDITHQDTDDYALFAVRQVSGSLNIVGRDQRGNKGESAIYSLLQAKIMALENSLRMNINEQIVGDGTGNGGKDIDGLAAVVGNATLAGLNPATFPAWQPGKAIAGDAILTRAGVDNTATNFDTTNAGTDTMRAVYINVSEGSDRPDGIFMSPIIWGEYSGELTPQVRYQDVQAANLGFETLFFEGAGTFFDHDIPLARIFLLNSRHIAFMRDSEADFAWLDDGQRPTDQDVFVRNMIVEGNVVTDNRHMNGTLTAVS